MIDSFSRYDVYAVAGSPYCYKDTNVLKNRFSLRDAKRLKEIETDLSSVRQSDLLNHPIQGHFTATHLCKIHRYLFGDVYSFAGHFRREDIMKGTTRFLSHGQIKEKLEKLFSELHAEKLLCGTAFETLTQRSAYYLAELNYIHPFREGNGRATREFMRQLFALNGYSVNWSAIPVDDLLHAMELSIYDTAELENALSLCLQENPNIV